MLKIWKLINLIIYLNAYAKLCSAGCTHTINETICLDIAICAESVDAQNVRGLSYDYGYARYPCALYLANRGNLFMSLTYLENGSGERITPVFYNSQIQDSIKHLNISNNDYEQFPMLANMKYLESLNISHNRLTSAYLSSRYPFSNLRDIDLSYNLIRDIKINSEYLFSELLKLNVSHNCISQIPDLIFADFDSLQYLDLSFNNLELINAVTFEGLKKLKYLNLEHNDIKEIGSSLFRFTQLKYLNFKSNELKTVLRRDFYKLHQLEEINLSHNAIAFIENTTFDSMSHLTTIDLKHNILNNLDVNLFKNTALTKIDLSSNSLQTIPKYIFRGKNITFIDLRQNSLKNELSKGIFEGLSCILELDLSYQKIAYLQDSAFYGLEKLEVLMLNNNILRNISEKSFISLRTLKSIDLSNNQITTLNFDISDLIELEYMSINTNEINSISQYFFKDTERIIYLDISHNNISHFIPHTFMNMSTLKTLDIRNNNLADVLDEYTFEGLQVLPILDISHSHITEVKNYSFYHMTSLHTLNISHSTVKRISFNSFVSNFELEIIDLSHNLLTAFKVNMSSLNTVRILYLSHNLIKFLTPITDLSTLSTINLSYNNLTIIDDDDLYNLTQLTYLDLSFNSNLKPNLTLKNIQTLQYLLISGISKVIKFEVRIPLTVLDMSKLNITNVTSLGITHLFNLNSLFLNNNNIQKLEVGAFSNLTRLETLDLSFNSLWSIQPGVFRDNCYLKTLNISNNQLISLNYGLFHGLVSLNVLDLSYNKLEGLESERFYGIQTLRTLIVDFNHISKIGLEEFSNYLTFLSIGGNYISCSDLVKFKNKYKNTKIGALKVDHLGDDIIDGVACSGRITIHNKQTENKFNTNDNILTEIRDVLLRMSSKDEVGTKYNSDKSSNSIKFDMIINGFNETKTSLQDLSQALNNSNALMTMYLNHTRYEAVNNLQNKNSTNTLLGRILQVLSTKNWPASEVHQDLKNISKTENIPNVNTLKQEFEHSFMTQKDNILSEINNKISLISRKVESVSTSMSLSEKVVQDSGLNSRLLYTEFCTSLILVISLSVIVYKLYKRFMYSRRRSISTQHFSNVMESSHL